MSEHDLEIAKRFLELAENYGFAYAWEKWRKEKGQPINPPGNNEYEASINHYFKYCDEAKAAVYRCTENRVYFGKSA